MLSNYKQNTRLKITFSNKTAQKNTILLLKLFIYITNITKLLFIYITKIKIYLYYKNKKHLPLIKRLR